MDADLDLSAESKEVARGSFWNLFGSIVFKLISFVYVVILARFASQDDVGVFYLAFSIITIFSIISELGIISSVGRYVPYFEGRKEYQKIRDLLRFSYYTAVVCVLLAIIIYWQADFFAQLYNSPPLAFSMRMMSVYVALYSVLKVHTNFLSSRMDMKSTQLLSNLQNAFKLLLTIILFYFSGATLANLCYAFVISHIPSLIYSIHLLERNKLQLPQGTEPLSIRQLVHEIMPFGIMLALLASFSIVVSSSDKILLGYFTDAQQVAIYTIATTFATVLFIFPSSIGTIFLPMISRLIGSGDDARVHTLLETSQRWTLFITLPMTIVLAIFSKQLLELFYGIAYSPGAPVMTVFTIGLAIQLFSYIPSIAIAAKRRVDIELKILASAAIVNVLLSYLWIPSYGIAGAAYASAVSFSMVSLLNLHYVRTLFKFQVSAGAYRLLLAALLSSAVLLLLYPIISGFQIPSISSDAILAKLVNLVTAVIFTLIAFAFFIPLSLLFKCFHKEDIVLMRSVLHRMKVPAGITNMLCRVGSYGVAS